MGRWSPMPPLLPNACDSGAAINGGKNLYPSCPGGRRWDAFLTGSAHVFGVREKYGMVDMEK